MGDSPFDGVRVLRFGPVFQTLEEAQAALDRLDHPRHPLVEFATEEIIACSFGMSTMDQVRAAVDCAFDSVMRSRRGSARQQIRRLAS